MNGGRRPPRQRWPPAAPVSSGTLPSSAPWWMVRAGRLIRPLCFKGEVFPYLRWLAVEPHDARAAHPSARRALVPQAVGRPLQVGEEPEVRRHHQLAMAARGVDVPAASRHVCDAARLRPPVLRRPPVAILGAHTNTQTTRRRRPAFCICSGSRVESGDSSSCGYQVGPPGPCAGGGRDVRQALNPQRPRAGGVGLPRVLLPQQPWRFAHGERARVERRAQGLPVDRH